MKFKDGAVVDENEKVGWIVLDSEKVKAIRLIIRDELVREAKIKMTVYGEAQDD